MYLNYLSRCISCCDIDVGNFHIFLVGHISQSWACQSITKVCSHCPLGLPMQLVLSAFFNSKFELPSRFSSRVGSVTCFFNSKVVLSPYIHQICGVSFFNSKFRSYWPLGLSNEFVVSAFFQLKFVVSSWFNLSVCMGCFFQPQRL